MFDEDDEVEFINIKVGKVPGRVEEYVLNGERTVAAALAVAGLDPTGYTITVNGWPPESGDELEDGDQVLLGKKTKGNS